MGRDSGVTNVTPRRRTLRIWMVLWAFVVGLTVIVLVSWMNHENPTTGQAAVSSQTPMSSARSASPSTSAPTVSGEPVVEVVYPDFEQVDRRSAEGVARTATTSLVTWDAATDVSEEDAVKRTVPLFDTWLKKQTTDSSTAEKSPWPEVAKQRQAFSQPQISDYRIDSNYENPNVSSTSSTDSKGRAVQTYSFRAEWTWCAGDDGSQLKAGGGSRVYRVDVVQNPKTKTWSVLDYSHRSESGN